MDGNAQDCGKSANIGVTTTLLSRTVPFVLIRYGGLFLNPIGRWRIIRGWRIIRDWGIHWAHAVRDESQQTPADFEPFGPYVGAEGTLLVSRSRPVRQRAKKISKPCFFDT